MVVVTYFLSYNSAYGYGLSNIPLFVIQNYEVYRVCTSILVHSHFFAAAFACYILYKYGTKLEQTHGSAVLLWWSMGLFTILLNTVAVALSYGMGDPTLIATATTANGMTVPALGIYTLDCCLTRGGATQRILFFEGVPTRYAPVILLVVWTLFSGMSVGNVLAVAMGYCMGHIPAMQQIPALMQPLFLLFLSPHPSITGWIASAAGSSSSSYEAVATLEPHSPRGQRLGTRQQVSRDDARTARLQALGQQQLPNV